MSVVLTLSLSGCMASGWLPMGGPALPTGTGNEHPAPATGRRLEPLPLRFIQHALSPDRRQLAYVTPGQKMPVLRLATFGGEAKALCELPNGLNELHWTGDGRALLYADTLQNVLPGPGGDWGLPATEFVASRLMRLALDGSAPEELAQLTMPSRFLFEADLQGDFIYYAAASQDQPGRLGQVRRIDLRTRAEDVVLTIPSLLSFDVSPDGKSIAYLSWEEGFLRVFDLGSRESRVLLETPAYPVWWKPDSRHLMIVRTGEGKTGATTIRTFDLTGAELPERVFSGNGGQLQVESLSPDGTRFLAYGPGNRNLILTLDTGEVTQLDSFGHLRGWLDDETVIGTYVDGHYAVPVPRSTGDAGHKFNPN